MLNFACPARQRAAVFEAAGSMMSLARQVRYLRKAVRAQPESIDTLHAVIALAIASLALPTRERRRQRTARLLETMLKRQILPDGGHVTRNPAHLPELLADLLPLAQCYLAASRAVPPELVRAIDRMLNARPGAMILIGNGDSAGLHHPAYDFNDQIIPAGISYWAKLAETNPAR